MNHFEKELHRLGGVVHTNPDGTAVIIGTSSFARSWRESLEKSKSYNLLTFISTGSYRPLDIDNHKK